MRFLSDIAVDSKGNLYVLNNFIGQILKYDSGGNLLADLSRPGQPPIPAKITAESAQNRVGHPQAIALDRQDNLYVLDGTSLNIHRFAANGQYLGQFRPDTGTNEGIGDPISIAVDETGTIYELDHSTGVVGKFDNTGKFLGEWGNPPGQAEPGLKDGYFKYPTALAADWKGHIYVADSDNYRIQKFDLNGKFLLKWGSQGQGDGQFAQYPGGMGFDIQGNFYVADRNNHRIQKFDGQGRFLAKFGSLGSDRGQFNFPNAVALNRQGQIYVADAGNERVQKLDAAGNWLASYGRQDRGEGQLNLPNSLGLDAAGNVYVADNYPHSIQKFDGQGRFVLRWEVPVKSDLPDDRLNLAVDSAGNVYVGLTVSERILKYDSQGRLLLEWGQGGNGPGQFKGLSGMTVDRHNQLWVADRDNLRLQKFDAQGHFLSQLAFSFYKDAGSDAEYKDAPVAVALDDQDQLYVLFSQFVRKFDAQGNFLLMWGDPQPGLQDGTFTLAKNILVDERGFVYVHSVGDFHGYGNRFQKFDNQGHLFFSWNSPLRLPMDPYITVVQPGELSRFDAVAVDRAGNFYMAGYVLGRVDKYLQK